MKPYALTAALVLLTLTPVIAAPVAGRVVQDSAYSSETLNRVTVIVGHETIERGINAAGVADEHLRAHSLFGALSLDVTPNSSVYVGMNQATADRVGELTGLNDRDDVDWFAGVQINIWNHMFRASDTVDARVSAGLTAEWANYSTVGDGAEATWNTIVIALPFAYQHFAARDVWSSIHSTKFFAGPLVSMIDGDSSSGGVKTSFDESENNGILLGVDVFATEDFVMGGQVQYFDEYSYSFSARYHF